MLPLKNPPRSGRCFSVIIYLNEGFAGGGTAFDEVAVSPQTGAAIVFAHELMHEGLPVSQGIKRVLRTDVMVRRQHAS